MLRSIALSALALAALAAPAAQGAAEPPPPDISKLTYDPNGFFKPGAAIPADYGKACDTIKGQFQDGIFNPSGRWNAFDNTIFEYFCLPYRDQGDTSAGDPMGNGGEARYGYCANPKATDPLPNAFADSGGAGRCPNHQLEYIDYYRKTMLKILADFNPVFHEYQYNQAEGTGRLPSITVAGADAPDETIVIGSHYDQTKSAPASFWDSQEGHAEMIRVAKLMADYWRSTGTRPSASVRFLPMDGEEDGSLGSRYYVNNIVADPDKVRSYWNADPCAGGYPARRYGNPADVLPINVQIGVPTASTPRVAAFNATVTNTVEQVLDAVDDNIVSYPDQPETFISTKEDAALSDMGKHIFVSTDKPALFSSDWSNFIKAGIPFFNPTPKVTGPSSPSGMQPSLYTVQNPYPDGVLGFHSPLDNLQTMSRFTGADPAGNKYPEAYMKGMEFCSNLLAWGMLQPNAGGAQTATDEPVAYFEALPTSSARVGEAVTFDATGSYQYADPKTRTTVGPSALEYRWDFGDGTTATGQTVNHAYAKGALFDAVLTVVNTATGAQDSMTLPIGVA